MFAQIQALAFTRSKHPPSVKKKKNYKRRTFNVVFINIRDQVSIDIYSSRYYRYFKGNK